MHRICDRVLDVIERQVWDVEEEYRDEEEVLQGGG